MTTRTIRHTSLTIGTAVALAIGGLGLSPGPAAASPGAPRVADDETVFPLGTQGGLNAYIETLALGGGKLSVLGTADPESYRGLWEFDLPAVGTPQPGPRRLAAQGVWANYPCEGVDPAEYTCSGFYSKLWALGDGRVAYMTPHGGQEALGGGAPESQTGLGPFSWESPDHVVAAGGSYVAVNDDDVQRIGSFDPAVPYPGQVHTRSVTAVSIWGTKLWKPGSTAGTVNSYDLVTKANSANVALGSGCVPDDLQAVGQWLYWRCSASDKAGVWDHSTGKNIPVPGARPAKVGDGYLVQQSEDGRTVTLTDFHLGGGHPAATTPFFTVPQGTSINNLTADRYGGHVAYTDNEQMIHIRPVTVPRSRISLFDWRTDSTVDLRKASDPLWEGTWRLTRPPASWKLTIKDAYGATVRTLTGSSHEGAAVRASWDGKDDAGEKAVSGRYHWTMTVDPGDGGAVRTLPTGSFLLSGGRSAFRDADTDGYGELYTMTSGGLLEAHRFSDGALTTSHGWSGWDPRTRFIPVGDMTGDNCSDMISRTTDGKLYRQSGGCIGNFLPDAERTLVGSGWGGFDTVVAADDFTGDHRPDLLARQAATGDLYLYRTNAQGLVDPGVRVGTGWKGYTVVGAADVTGDGIGDLIARDAGGELWRYDGNGTGGFKPRTLVFQDWGAGRNAIIAVGDVTGDGFPDLVSRTTDGKLLRNKGWGDGTFSATYTLATGWTYPALF
ncbi:FG-GAP-like repeat-containing protein [Streptomyces sp. NBC_01235]|uniref:FG-GAP-like repeat-containing protein n=1 Tax=Streptomyces sp. NBC_01235 TaxID=2903788 RepID=UPI002E115ED4|nr:FG-GAP-like repeat-containing protein [Streptomyces sp. NBC_01235]